MSRISHNELLGTVALQSALENSYEDRLSLAKAMLVLPLLFDKAVLSVLKNRNSVVLSSKDLLISKPSAFITIRARYGDLTITSLNTIILARELGMVLLDDDCLILKKKIFSRNQTNIGTSAMDLLKAGPKLGLVLSESALNLYQTFRIEL